MAIKVHQTATIGKFQRISLAEIIRHFVKSPKSIEEKITRNRFEHSALNISK